MIKKLLYKWHCFWFKHHMDWLMDDYRKETWQAIYEAVNQVLNEVSTVKGLKPMGLESYVKLPHYYNAFTIDIDGQKVCKIIKEGENHE
jgi:predicted alpha-1,6-mannanase (GH76 family)